MFFERYNICSSHRLLFRNPGQQSISGRATEQPSDVNSSKSQAHVRRSDLNPQALFA